MLTMSMTLSGDGRVIGRVSLIHFAAHVVVSQRCFNTVVGEILTLVTLGEGFTTQLSIR
jgi:hypothetical protein